MSMLAEIRCPLVLAVPNQNHRSPDAQNQLIHCSLVGSHKFKPKSQYNINNAGPNRVPCGTPHDIFMHSELVSLS